MNATATLTTKLNNGKTVLAKRYRGDICAKTFANQTQADNAAAKLTLEGVKCWVWQGRRPFYVVIEEA